MAQFNFTGAALNSYKFIWKERRMLLHYGFWPIMLKIASFSIIGLLGYERNLMRQGLCLLPANFLEGWLVAIAIRYAIFGESRPEPLNAKMGPQTPAAFAARRAILGGIILYMLINLLASLTGGMMVSAGQMPTPANEPEPSAGTYFAMLMFVALVIYLFRFLWLHVPIIMEVPMSRYLRAIEGFNSSLYMLGLWMMCMLPVLAFLAFLGQVLETIYGGPVGGSIVMMQVIAFFRAFTEVLVAVVSGVAMAYAVRDILTGANKKNPKAR